jgi:hypothetical protein
MPSEIIKAFVVALAYPDLFGTTILRVIYKHHMTILQEQEQTHNFNY